MESKTLVVPPMLLVMMRTVHSYPPPLLSCTHMHAHTCTNTQSYRPGLLISRPEKHSASLYHTHTIVVPKRIHVIDNKGSVAHQGNGDERLEED